MANNEKGLPTPIPRKEKYLAKAAGMDVEIPKAITREEMYLEAIANGSGGGGGSNYITVGGIRVYVSATTPTGDIPDGSVGVGW